MARPGCVAVLCAVLISSVCALHTTHSASPTKTRLLTQLNNQPVGTYSDADTFAASLLELHAGVHCTNNIYDGSTTSMNSAGTLYNVIANNDGGDTGGDSGGDASSFSVDDNADTVLLQTELQTRTGALICPGAKPEAKTCCSAGGSCAASCPHANANCCANSQFCCPEGSQCVTKAGGRVHCRVHAKKKNSQSSWGSKSSASNAFGDLLKGSQDGLSSQSSESLQGEAASSVGGMPSDLHGLPTGRQLSESIEWLKDRLKEPVPDPTPSRSLSSELPHTNSMSDPLLGVVPSVLRRHHAMPRSVNIVNRIVIDTLPSSDSPLPPKTAKPAKQAAVPQAPATPQSTSESTPPPPEPTQPQPQAANAQPVPSTVSTNAAGADTTQSAYVQGIRSVPKVQ